jgi:hypothetical protein
VVKSTKNLETAQSPRARCPTGLFIAEDQEPYYNIMIVLNYLPVNRVHSQGQYRLLYHKGAFRLFNDMGPRVDAHAATSVLPVMRGLRLRPLAPWPWPMVHGLRLLAFGRIYPRAPPGCFPTKIQKHIFWVSESIVDTLHLFRAQLAGFAIDTPLAELKARP